MPERAELENSVRGSAPDYLKDRDVVKELSAACRLVSTGCYDEQGNERKMHFVGYILALEDWPIWENPNHDDWRMLNSETDAAGQEAYVPYGRFLCCNSPRATPSYRDLVRDRLKELARNYPDLHGAYFDMFYWPRVACYCQYCRERFKAQPSSNGQYPPAKEDFGKPLWRSWQEFQHRNIEDSLRDWRQAVREVRPDFVILANTWNGWIFRDPENGASSVRVADNLDGTIEEEGWYWGAGVESFFGFPQRWPFMNLYLRSIGDNAAGPGRCVAHMWEAGAVRPALNAPLPTEEVVARVADMISFGVHPWPYFRRGPQEMKRVFDFIKEREPWLNDARLVPWCGLVVSANTQYWYGKDDPIPRYMEGIHGALRALWEQHLPVEIVTDEDLEHRDLAPYSVLLLDNTACLSETAAQRIREYVQTGGGGLVATYESSLYDEGGQKRPDFALRDLFGAKFVSAAMEPSVEKSPLLGPTPNQAVLTPKTLQLLQARADDFTGEPAWGMPFPAGTLITQADDTARVALTLSCYDEQGNPVSPPGLVAGKAGQGKVVYVAADLGKSAFFCNLEYVDHVLADALRWAAREGERKAPVVEVTALDAEGHEVPAPRTVLSVPQQQGTRLVVHLLNDYSSFGRSSVVKDQSIALRHEVLPVRDLLVTFCGETCWKRFTLEPGGLCLSPQKTPLGTTVKVPEITWHGMVVAEP